METENGAGIIQGEGNGRGGSRTAMNRSTNISRNSMQIGPPVLHKSGGNIMSPLKRQLEKLVTKREDDLCIDEQTMKDIQQLKLTMRQLP
jgi:hypothetical protein